MKKLLSILFLSLLITHHSFSQTITTNTIYRWNLRTGFHEVSTPPCPATNYCWVYYKSDGELYMLDESCVEKCLSCASGVGSVTSVGLTVPSILSVAGSPITTSGTFAVTLASQSQNLFFLSPNGSAGVPTFRIPVPDDLEIGTTTGDVTGKRYYANYVAGTDAIDWRRIVKTDVSGLDANEVLFGEHSGSGEIQQSDSLVYTSSNKLGLGLNTTALTARFTVKGFGISTTDTIFLAEDGNGSDRLWVTDDGTAVYRPDDNVRYNYNGNSVSYIDDAGTIRDQNFLAAKYTFQFGNLRNSNIIISPSTGLENYIDFTASGTDAFVPGDVNMAMVSIRPTWNIATATNNGDVIGFYYSPIVTALAGSNKHWGLFLQAGYTRLGNVDNSASDSVLVMSSREVFWRDASTFGGGSGETNTASNLGGGLANYSTKVGVDLQFNSFTATDFDLAANLISLDFTNAQKASSSVPGFATSNQIIGNLTLGVDGQGGVVSTGSKGFITVPNTMTLTHWYVACDVSGSIQFDLKQGGTSLVGGGGNKPLVSAAISGNAAISGWTDITLAAGDILEWVVDSGATITNCSCVIKGYK